MNATRKAAATTITLLLAACRSNQDTIQQAARNLTTQSRQVADTPQPGTASGALIAAGAVIALLIGTIMISIVLYRRAMTATEKAAHERHRAAFKVREAQQRYRTPSQPTFAPPPPVQYPHQPRPNNDPRFPGNEEWPQS